MSPLPVFSAFLLLSHFPLSHILRPFIAPYFCLGDELQCCGQLTTPTVYYPRLADTDIEEARGAHLCLCSLPRVEYALHMVLNTYLVS